MANSTTSTIRTFTVICPGRKERVFTGADVAAVKSRAWECARQLAQETGEKVRITGGIWRR